jgi:hypothetical protein
MNYTLDASNRKRLTEFLGECPHRWKFTRLSSVDGKSECQICGKTVWDGEKIINRRTFTTPDDRQALCEKLWEKDAWEEFYCFARLKFDELHEGLSWDFIHSYWIMVEQPERLCYLIAKFLEGQP